MLSTQPAPPSTDIYNQAIPSSGYGYLTTRDGTKLAINVHPPQDVTKALPGRPAAAAARRGPDADLIEYSGYGYADPAGPQSGIAILANLMGFTVVDVNMRGTGCSGGAFDFFEPLQSLDGYDVIETIARQPWVLHHKVGMMGISYGGISQLFTAQTHPPSLAAISPLSVIDATQTTLYPGGILNTGFAVDWAKERSPRRPAGVTQRRAALGLQADPGGRPDLRGQPGPAPRGGGPDGQDPRERPLHARRSPTRWRRSRSSTRSTCRCSWPASGPTSRPAATARRSPSASPARSTKWFTFTNGTHVDSLDPETFNRWYDFLQLYVAKQAPIINSAAIQRRRAGDLPGGDGDHRA